MPEFKILTTEEEVRAISQEWEKLQDDFGQWPSGYMWYDAWWQHMGKSRGKTPFIATARVNGELVALVALSIQVKKGVRILQGAGADVSSFFEAIAKKPEYIEELWRAIRKCGLFDFAILRNVEHHSGFGKTLSKFARVLRVEKCLFLNNEWKNGEAWEASLNSKLRQNTRRHTKKLMAKGKVDYVAALKNDYPPHLIADMMEYKKQWGIAGNIPGLHALSGAVPYFEQLAAELSKRGELHFSWLTFDGKAFAYQFSNHYKGTFYTKMISNNPEYQPYSPGNFVMQKAIAWAIDHGFKKINYGLGDFPYKRYYANDSVEFSEWIFGASLKGKVFVILYVLMQCLKLMYAD